MSNEYRKLGLTITVAELRKRRLHNLFTYASKTLFDTVYIGHCIFEPRWFIHIKLKTKFGNIKYHWHNNQCESTLTTSDKAWSDFDFQAGFHLWKPNSKIWQNLDLESTQFRCRIDATRTIHRIHQHDNNTSRKWLE